MSDRLNSLTVVLEKEMKTEDAELIINAIKMIRGVANIIPGVATSENQIAKEMARLDLIKGIYKVLNP